jgi:hypothetical protein
MLQRLNLSLLHLKLWIFLMVCPQAHLFLVSSWCLIIQNIREICKYPKSHRVWFPFHIKLHVTWKAAFAFSYWLVTFPIINVFNVTQFAYSPDENVTYPTITAFQSATLRITFSFKKQPGKPQETTISASFTNLATTTFTDFVFQAAVLKVAFASDTNLIPDNRDIK